MFIVKGGKSEFSKARVVDLEKRVADECGRHGKREFVASSIHTYTLQWLATLRGRRARYVDDHPSDQQTAHGEQLRECFDRRHLDQTCALLGRHASLQPQSEYRVVLAPHALVGRFCRPFQLCRDSRTIGHERGLGPRGISVDARRASGRVTLLILIVCGSSSYKCIVQSCRCYPSPVIAIEEPYSSGVPLCSTSSRVPANGHSAGQSANWSSMEVMMFRKSVILSALRSTKHEG